MGSASSNIVEHNFFLYEFVGKKNLFNTHYLTMFMQTPLALFNIIQQSTQSRLNMANSTTSNGVECNNLYCMRH